MMKRQATKEVKSGKLQIQLRSRGKSKIPILFNCTSVTEESGMVYLDFGFLDPEALDQLPGHLQLSANTAVTLNGRLLVSIVAGKSTISALHQQLGNLIDKS